MTRKLAPKTTYDARRSAFQLLLFFLVIAVASAVCIYDERLLCPLVPFGLLALALLVSEFERNGLLGPFARRKLCEVGADGLLVGEDFFSWRDVLCAKRDESDSGKRRTARAPPNGAYDSDRSSWWPHGLRILPRPRHPSGESGAGAAS